MVGYSGWRLPDGFLPQRGAGVAGSFNEDQWLYAPTGRKGIAQGKAKRRPGIRYAMIFASPERAEPAVRQSMRTCFALSGLWRIGAAAYLGRSRTTQGGAALYPGLSHYAPLGRTIRLQNAGTVPAFCPRVSCHLLLGSISQNTGYSQSPMQFRRPSNWQELQKLIMFSELQMLAKRHTSPS